MQKVKKTLVASLVLGVALNAMSFSIAGASVDPAQINSILGIGGSMVVEKHVTTPEIPTLVDVCLLEDETGSFYDDIANLKSGTTASDIFDTVVASSPGAQFAVAGFRDYPVYPFGAGNDYVYRLLSPMSPVKANWLAGINSLTAGGGSDIPEAQFDAIVAASGPGTFTDPTLGVQGNCGWRDKTANPGVQRILVVTTDAVFHNPSGSHVNNLASTITALNNAQIRVIGLKAAGAGSELNSLATATGGSVQPLSSDGSNIATAIINGIQAVTTDVWFEVTSSDPGLNVTLTPAVHYNVSGNSTVNFTETITVDNNVALEGTTLYATVTFFANHYPEEGSVIGVEEIAIQVPDKTAPVSACPTTVNPHGLKKPAAGRNDLPGTNGGQNEDGYYELTAIDLLDTNPTVYVVDMATGFQFGPFVSGTKIKYTEANGITPVQKKIGSNAGQAGAVDWHIFGQGDFYTYSTDSSGNTSEKVECLVPAPLK